MLQRNLRGPLRPAHQPQERPREPHGVVVLQRSAGNAAVAQLVTGAPPVVQRATRDELVVAFQAAVRNGSWQEAATRLNGFADADILRFASGLALSEAALTRAAVAIHLSGWPQQPLILAALEQGRPEVMRIGRIYQAYDEAVRDGNWVAATQQLHAMSEGDIDYRLRRLPPDSLHPLCVLAPTVSERIPPLAVAVAKARGIEVPEGEGPLKVGDRIVGDTREYRSGGEPQYIEMNVPLAQGEGASIGLRQIAEGAITVAGLVPLSRIPNLSPGGPESGTFRTQPPQSGTFRTQPPPTPRFSPGSGGLATAEGAAAREAARRIAPLAIRVPVIGVAFVAGFVGPFAAGWALAHAAEVQKALGEFGGTSAPGGVPLSGGTLNPVPEPAPGEKHDDEDAKCSDCPPGTSPGYGPLDALGRATGVRATLRGRTWSGQRPGEDPSGFVSGVSGKLGGQHRAHLLARTLGGSGAADNLVPFGGAENIAMYHQAESVVEEHITLFPNHCVQFISRPIYDGDSPTPRGIHVFGFDLCTREVIINEIVPNRPLH